MGENREYIYIPVATLSPQNDSHTKMWSDESYFNVSLIVFFNVSLIVFF